MRLLLLPATTVLRTGRSKLLELRGFRMICLANACGRGTVVAMLGECNTAV